jgi:hypothetical protein
MNNFLDFIIDDIAAKKELLSTMPQKDLKDKEKINNRIKEIKIQYLQYKDSIIKFMDKTASKINPIDTNYDYTKVKNLEKNIKELEDDMYILNPLNSFVEKMKFSKYLYIFENYADFTFDFINDMLLEILNKYDEAGINIKPSDFYYNTYVHDYMAEFLKLKNKGITEFDELLPKFEEYYWRNPDLILHIGLNFSSISYKNREKLKRILHRNQKEVMKKHNVTNFEECTKKLKEAYLILNNTKKETIVEIFDKALNGEIDIKNYLENSKVKKEVYNLLVIDPIAEDDIQSQEKFFEDLVKLKNDLKQYIEYQQIMPLIEVFKSEYKKFEESKNGVFDKNSTKKLNSLLEEQEKKVEALINKYYGASSKLLKKINDKKETRFKAVEYSNKINELYNQLRQDYYYYSILPLINEQTTVKDVLYIYYTNDYYKKKCINLAYENKGSYKNFEEKCIAFDSFAIDPTHDLLNSVQIYKDLDLKKVIVTKHRLNNINITIDDLEYEEAKNLLDKVNLLLRDKIILQSNVTAEDIYFVAKKNAIFQKEGISKETKN